MSASANFTCVRPVYHHFPKLDEYDVFTLEAIARFKGNVAWLPRCQAYLCEHQPSTLIAWGPQEYPQVAA
jgi:hypothetical protein